MIKNGNKNNYGPIHVACTYLKLVYHNTVIAVQIIIKNQLHFKNCVKSTRNRDLLNPETDKVNGRTALGLRRWRYGICNYSMKPKHTRKTKSQ